MGTWEKHGGVQDSAEAGAPLCVSFYFVFALFASLDDVTGKKFISIKMVNKDL